MTRFVANATNRYKARKYQNHFLHALTDAELDLSIEWLYFLTLPNIKVVYDVGAADGNFSATCAKLSNIEAVVAFEPGLEALDSLYHLAKETSKIRAMPVALGPSCGMQTFYLTKDGRASSCLPPDAKLERLYPGRGLKEQVTVEVKTLDYAIEQTHLPLPDIIKLDTQGYELEVLAGAQQTLEHVSFCIVECSYEQLYDDAPLIGDVFKFFSDRDWSNVGTAPASRSGTGKPIYTDLVFASAKVWQEEPRPK